MKLLLKVFSRLLVIIGVMYIFMCTYLYFNQESILFVPRKLAVKHVFKFDRPYEERFFETPDKIKLNALLFPADSSRGLIFYLHGNAGSLDGWGDIAAMYNARGYDLFLFDYRGFGKSGGHITSESQFFEDIRLLYREMKKKYTEDKISVIGYSIGTGPAAMLAAENEPKQLILLSPYYSMPDMMHQRYSFVPEFILTYRFETYRYLDQLKAPVSIFHGREDQTIYFGSSLKLKKHFKPGDRLFPLESQAHNGMDNNAQYQAELDALLP